MKDANGGLWSSLAPHGAVALLVGSLTGSLVVLSACEKGGGGDPDVELQPLPYGKPTQKLGVINDPATGTVSGQRVLVSGAQVLHEDTFDELGDGSGRNRMYVQDSALEPPPYGGMLVFQPQFSPPTLRVMPGDVVDLAGPWERFALPRDTPRPIPEMSGARVTFRFDPVNPVVAHPMTILQLLDDAESYRWLSMLVTLEDVAVLSLSGITRPPDYKKGDKAAVGRASVSLFAKGGISTNEQPKITNELFDLGTFVYEHPLANQDRLKRITGIMTLFGSFNIAPRSADDIVLQ